MEEDVKVRVFKCKCGKARMLSVINPNGEPFSKEVKKEHRKLVDAGCDVSTMSLEDARKQDMCFTCKL
jgi:hypothetical protein